MHAIAGVWLQGSASSSVLPPENLCQAMLRALCAAEANIETPRGLAIALGSCAFPGASAPFSEASHGHICDHEGGVTVVADIRLDNRDHLAQALSLGPGQLRETSDISLLLKAWRQWGEACVEHLEGGFALACWDGARRTLFLARDHAGERPLFFSRVQGLFAFASMPRGLSELPKVGSRLDQERMLSFLSILSPATTQTFFQGIERLPPGYCLTATPGKVQLRRYWHPADAKPIRYKRDEEYLADFHERFDRAVTVRLRTAGRIGSHLSGGLDSSSVTVTAARLLAARGSDLTAFTSVPVPGFKGVTLPGRFGDEGPAAAEVAAMYPNIEHVLINLVGKDVLASMDRFGRLADQPVFNVINQTWLEAILDESKARGIRVLLEGGGGNASISFGGLVGLSDLFRAGRWFMLAKQVRQLRANGHTSWRGAASWAVGPVTPSWLRQLFDPEMREFSFAFSPIHPERSAEHRLKERVFEEFFASDTSETFRRKFYEYFDPGSVNSTATAGWGIECRDPTLDKNVFEFCYAIPIEQYLAGGQNRSLIRRAMQGRLPAATLQRTTSGLQAADWYLILGPMRDRLGAELAWISQSPLARHLLDLPRLRHLLESWPSSGYERPIVDETYHFALTRGLAAGHFIAQHDPEMPK